MLNRYWHVFSLIQLNKILYLKFEARRSEITGNENAASNKILLVLWWKKGMKFGFTETTSNFWKGLKSLHLLPSLNQVKSFQISVPHKLLVLHLKIHLAPLLLHLVSIHWMWFKIKNFPHFLHLQNLKLFVVIMYQSDFTENEELLILSWLI